MMSTGQGAQALPEGAHCAKPRLVHPMVRGVIGSSRGFMSPLMRDHGDPEEAKIDHSELCGACAIGYHWEKVSQGTGKAGDGL